jgi:hypothetical protein
MKALDVFEREVVSRSKPFFGGICYKCWILRVSLIVNVYIDIWTYHIYVQLAYLNRQTGANFLKQNVLGKTVISTSLQMCHCTHM